MDRNYLFIVGAGRSGTKFLMNILNNSRYVHIAPEIHFFSSVIHDGFLKNLKKGRRAARGLTLDEVIHCFQRVGHFGTYWRRDLNLSSSEIRNWFREKELSDRNIYEFIIEFDYVKHGNSKKNAKYIGEKTPFNFFHVGKLLKWFPRSKVLLIYRDPLNVLGSEVNKGHKPDYPVKKSNVLYPYGLLLYVSYMWFVAAVIALYYKCTSKDRFMIVSYEDLDSKTEDTVELICSEIRIPYREELCSVDKVDSSYSGNQGGFWYPPRWIVLFYKSFFAPVRSLLDRAALKPEQ